MLSVIANKDSFLYKPSNLITGRTDLSPKVKRILTKDGNAKINSLTIVRNPLQPVLMAMLNIASLGEFKEKMKNTPYDKLYHLSVILDTDQGRFLLEKNEKINMDLRPTVSPKADTKAVTLGDHPTINELIEKTKQILGNRFIVYSSKDANCQDFIVGVLKALGVATPDNLEFVKQDTDSLFSDKFRKVANTVTDIGERIDQLAQGGRLKNVSRKGIMSHQISIGLSKYQISQLKKHAPVQLSHEQISGGSIHHPHRVHLTITPAVVKRLQLAHATGKGMRIKGGDFKSFFHNVGDTLKRGWDYVKENAGDAVEAVKSVVPKEAVKKGIAGLALAGSTMMGAPELGIMATPLINSAVDTAYKHDFRQPLSGPRQKKGTLQEMQDEYPVFYDYRNPAVISSGEYPVHRRPVGRRPVGRQEASVVQRQAPVIHHHHYYNHPHMRHAMTGGDAFTDFFTHTLNPTENGTTDFFTHTLNPNENGTTDAFRKLGDAITNGTHDATNTIQNYFDKNGKWIAGQAIDTIPALGQVLGSMAGEALGTMSGVPLLIPVGAALGSQLGLEAGKYTADQIHQVAGVGLGLGLGCGTKKHRGRKPKGGSVILRDDELSKQLRSIPVPQNTIEPAPAQGSGVKSKRFVKGSPEAKAFMASLRAKRTQGKGLYA